MDFIHWNEKMQTDISVIDMQHKKLIKIINDVHNSKSVMAQYELQKTLDWLLLYTKIHFLTEERFFSLIKYPNEKKHKTKHDHFRMRLEELVAVYKKGNNVTAAEELFYFLKDWMKKHILNKDQEYANFFFATIAEESVREEIVKNLMTYASSVLEGSRLQYTV